MPLKTKNKTKKRNTKHKQSRVKVRKTARKLPVDSLLLYKHPAIYQKEGKYGMSTFSKKNIPTGTIIIKELPNNIPDEKDDDYPFKLIKHLLENKKEDFLNMVPNELDETMNVDYNTIRDRHMKYLPELSEDLAKLYYMKYRRNAFGFGNNPAILFYATKLNHSCNPHVTYHKNGNCMEFETIRPIRANEEIFDSYVNTHSPKQYRQDDLLRRYGFQCNCDKCANDQDHDQNKNQDHGFL